MSVSVLDEKKGIEAMRAFCAALDEHTWVVRLYTSSGVIGSAVRANTTFGMYQRRIDTQIGRPVVLMSVLTRQVVEVMPETSMEVVSERYGTSFRALLLV